jgi:hypothetical protein
VECLNDFIRFYETIGKGAFCKVKRVVGTFTEDDGNKVEEPYALKIYNKTALKVRTLLLNKTLETNCKLLW